MTISSQSLLRRFVIDGLRETIDFYTAGALPLHRFAWELDVRLSTLAELTGLPHWQALAMLRSAQRAVASVDAAQRSGNRGGLTRADERALSSAVATLRAMLARIDSSDPVDPARRDGPRPVGAFSEARTAGQASPGKHPRIA